MEGEIEGEGGGGKSIIFFPCARYRAVTIRNMLTRIRPRASIAWHRWCLPSFSAHCDQNFKGMLSDGDHSFCDTLMRKYRKEKNAPQPGLSQACPWENPLCAVYADSFGI